MRSQSNVDASTKYVRPTPSDEADYRLSIARSTTMTYRYLIGMDIMQILPPRLRPR
ncbi:hypothetical protein U2A4042450008 [Corynebacterium striatum]|nr:hypothetical protein U2A4042450008 [Corynebacterium striatum]